MIKAALFTEQVMASNAFSNVFLEQITREVWLVHEHLAMETMAILNLFEIVCGERYIKFSALKHYLYLIFDEDNKV